MLSAHRPVAALAQQPESPPLLAPVDDYQGTGSQDNIELRQFRQAEFDSGNMAWVIIGSLASLFLITPGLLFVYCGLLHSKDSSAIMVRYLGLIALLSMSWVLWTYSLAFARSAESQDVLPGERLVSQPVSHRSPGRLIGSTDHVAMRGLAPQLGNRSPLYPLRRQYDRIPHVLFMIYQLMFFISVPVPLFVSLHERLTAVGLAGFVVLWGTLVYAPITHWIWGGGWLAETLDTAGGIPAHVSVGFSVLVAAWLTRCGRAKQEPSDPPRQIVYLGLGVTLFWSGSLLCSASRSMAADVGAVNNFVTTFLAGGAGLLGWTGMDWLSRGKAYLTGYCLGPLAGLVAIAAGSGYVAPQSSIVIGLAGGAMAAAAYAWLERRDADPILAVVIVHAVGGTLGAMLTGLFATASVAGFDQHGDPINGLIAGDLRRVAGQTWAALSAACWAAVGTLIAFWIVRVSGGIRRTSVRAADGPH